jgi:hypothetical protein
VPFRACAWRFRVEDDATSGWVFFFTDEPVSQQTTVELLDPTGDVVASGVWGMTARPRA